MTPIETALASTAIKSATPAARLLGRLGKAKYDRFVALYTKAFDDHLHDAYRKAAKVKNILYKDQSANTDEKYVNVEFKFCENRIGDKHVIDKIKGRDKVIVTGTGGAGKTMFTKWLVLRIIESISSHQLIPLFIDLRDISERDDLENFAVTLFKRTSRLKGSATFDQFLEGLNEGVFLIVLDAADEIRKSIRQEAILGIRRFANEFHNCGMLVTSREITELDGITEFDVHHTCPLLQPQVVSIIEKLDYDEDVKISLIQEIKSGLYESHRGFLSNPLMATIMLLTYDQSKSIPTKRSTFYKRAFEALYERHDSHKGIYRRDHHAGLPMDEFERVFATFCYGTYVNSRFEFSEAEIIRLFRESAELCGIDENPEDISRDAIESVCLIQREGHDYVFSHRLFQEYFSALYIKLYRKNDIESVIAAALQRGRGENVGSLLFEMDQESLEINYVLPGLKKINRIISKFDLESPADVIKYLRMFVIRLYIDMENLAVEQLSHNLSKNIVFIFSINNLYSETSWYNRFFGSGRNSIFSSFDRIEKNKSISSKSLDKMKVARATKDSVSIEIDSDCEPWIMMTAIPSKLADMRAEFQNLEKSLSKKYANDGGVRTVFSSFGRADT